MIKVADFGLTEDMYGTNYFRREKGESGSEEKVPIRWMAPESIEEDIYTEATDVVRTRMRMNDASVWMCCVALSAVVVWCDGVGGADLWEGPIPWCSSHGSAEGTAERRETGET